MPAQEIECVAVNPMSRRCPQVRGHFPSIDGSDDIDILFCNGESTGVRSSVLSVSVYLLPPCEYAESVLLPLCSPGGIAMSRGGGEFSWMLQLLVRGKNFVVESSLDTV